MSPAVRASRIGGAQSIQLRAKFILQLELRRVIGVDPDAQLVGQCLRCEASAECG